VAPVGGCSVERRASPHETSNGQPSPRTEFRSRECASVGASVWGTAAFRRSRVGAASGPALKAPSGGAGLVAGAVSMSSQVYTAHRMYLYGGTEASGRSMNFVEKMPALSS
jgi:hypothetical protein